MDNGIYVMLTRQLALFQDMDVTANNIANVNTTGYNGQQMVFESYLFKDVNQGDPNTMAMAHNLYAHRNTQNGPIEITNNPLDVALEGEGYFEVDTPLGTRYTRAGNFTLSANGTLVTSQGYPVLDLASQRIEFPETATQIDIGSAGNIRVDGEEFATINVVRFANPQLLERAGDTLFKADIPAEAADPSTRVIQGSLERANIQGAVELTHMLEVSRNVTNTAKYIEAMYDLQRKSSEAWTRQN